MKTVLVTGSQGFIGKNLMEALSRQDGIKITSFTAADNISTLGSLLEDVDIIYHLAGVNRPIKSEEFVRVNTGFTENIVSILFAKHKTPTIVMSSSTQAELDNPYGISKKKAEDILIDYGKRTGAPVYIYRLTNVFGKWCRPNYNSVVATFCHNIAHGLDIKISDRNKVLGLVYIDDVVNSFLNILDYNEKPVAPYVTIRRTYKITLGELADKIYKFRDIRKSLEAPDISDEFMKCLYTTYLSYLDNKDKLV
ncbi:MAG TPA: NAD-dependent epimerase/dehydratase family protein [Candidatus Wunengus sp. YC65]|uniref:NAD-dependent epimerase/dehydratase family protein n=1 Tax=Candidatus Wunengus sp. YC65 TaxID=3367701 RepID=UPI00402A1D74